MRPKERRETGQRDLFRPRLEQIARPRASLVRLGGAIDWSFLEQRFGAVYRTARPAAAGDPPDGGAVHPQAPARPLRRGAVRARVENPYFQFFCGEEFFQHRLAADRSSLTRWRGRMGEERLAALLQESLATATRTGAALHIGQTASISVRVGRGAKGSIAGGAG